MQLNAGGMGRGEAKGERIPVMTLFLKSLPILAALFATPALAAAPDPHADHQPPAATAKPDAKAETRAGMPACPMMAGKMAMATPPKDMPQGKSGASMPMMKGDMHCMHAAEAKPQTAQPPAGAAAEEHDHDHPAK
jgi:hypothetical protein